MSSILDALEKIEATGGPQPPGGPGRAPERGRPWKVAALVASALVAGAGGAVFLLGGPAQPPAATTPGPQLAATPKPPVAADPTPGTVATAAASPAAPAASEPPPAAATTPRRAAPVPAPYPGTPERPWGTEPPEASTPPSTAMLAVMRATPPPTVPPTPRAAEEPMFRPATRAPAGAPRLRVSFLVYSNLPARRSVALTFDGGSLTTLREGEQANGVEVVHIRPDRVELRWQGETFTLEVRS